MKKPIYDSMGHVIGAMCGTKEECDKFESTWNEAKKKHGDTFAVSYMINNFKV